jgi:hypothetical protein
VASSGFLKRGKTREHRECFKYKQMQPMNNRSSLRRKVAVQRRLHGRRFGQAAEGDRLAAAFGKSDQWFIFIPGMA